VGALEANGKGILKKGVGGTRTGKKREKKTTRLSSTSLRGTPRKKKKANRLNGGERERYALEGLKRGEGKAYTTKRRK